MALVALYYCGKVTQGTDSLPLPATRSRDRASHRETIRTKNYDIVDNEFQKSEDKDDKIF